MVTDEQRGRYGRWLRRERLAKGWSVDEARARLARDGYRIGESSYAEWESGRKRPSRDALPFLEALFGPVDPEVQPEAASSDLAALIERLDRQAQAIEDLAASVALLTNTVARQAEGQQEFLQELLLGVARELGTLRSDPAAPSAERGRAR